MQIHPDNIIFREAADVSLISESVRGEGAVLYNKDKERFVK